MKFVNRLHVELLVNGERALREHCINKILFDDLNYEEKHFVTSVLRQLTQQMERYNGAHRRADQNSSNFKISR